MLSVSVVIPTYNGARFIEEAIRSVLLQSLLPEEIIVIDDCSKDNTCELVRSVAENSVVPIQLVELSQNSGGPARPINIGIGAAQSEFISVLDQDDVFNRDKLLSQARVLSENPDVALVAGFCALTDGTTEVHCYQNKIYEELVQTAAPKELPKFAGREVLRSLIRYGNYFMGYPAFMFRKKSWESKGGVNERLRVGSDDDLLCWLCTQGDVVIDNAIRYARRVHDSNVCNNMQAMYLDFTRVRADCLLRNRWLLEDPSLNKIMRDWFGSFGGSLREAGNYRAAWECYRLTASVWGWDTRLLRALCKFPVHWVWTRLTHRPPVYTYFTEVRSRIRAEVRSSKC